MARLKSLQADWMSFFYRANIHLSKKDIQSACNDFKRANELDFKRAEEALTAHCNRD